MHEQNGASVQPYVQAEATAGVPVPHPNLPTDHKSAPIQKRDKPKPDAGVAPCDGGEK